MKCTACCLIDGTAIWQRIYDPDELRMHWTVFHPNPYRIEEQPS